MSQRFSALTSTVPVTDVGVTTERVTRQRVDVNIGARELTIGERVVPYSEIQSAELHRFDAWPLTSYALVMVVGDEVISVRVPGVLARAGFPFECVERDMSLPRSAELRPPLLWYLYGALALIALALGKYAIDTYFL